MSTRNDRPKRRLGTLITLTLIVPGIVMAAIRTTDPADTGTRQPAGWSEPHAALGVAGGSGPGVAPDYNALRAPTAPAAQRGETWRIRCWQFGRLLFEEDDVVLPPDLAPYAEKLRATDRQRGTVVVAETRNATCLIKSRAGERAWGAQR